MSWRFDNDRDGSLDDPVRITGTRVFHGAGSFDGFWALVIRSRTERWAR